MIFTGVTAWLICMLYMVSASGSPRHPQPPHPQPSLAAATGSPPSTRHEHAAAPVCPQVAYFMEGLQRTLLGLVEVVLNGLWVVFWLSAAASFAAEPLCKPSSECRGRPAAGHSHRLAATGLAQHGAPYAACWGGVCGGWVGHGGRGGGGVAGGWLPELPQPGSAHHGCPPWLRLHLASCSARPVRFRQLLHLPGGECVATPRPLTVGHAPASLLQWPRWCRSATAAPS